MQTSTLPVDRPTITTPSVLYSFSAEQRRASFIIKVVGVVLALGLLAIGATRGEFHYLPWCLGLLGLLALLDAACTSQARRYAEQHNEIARRLAANGGGKIYERDWLLVPTAQPLPQAAMGVLRSLASPGVIGFHVAVLLLTALPLSGALDHIGHSGGGSKAVAGGCGSGCGGGAGGCGSGGCGSGTGGCGGGCGSAAKSTAQGKAAAATSVAKMNTASAIRPVAQAPTASALPQQPVLKNGKVYMTMPPHTNPRQHLPLPTRPAAAVAASKPSVVPVNRPALPEAVSPSGPAPSSTTPLAQPASPSTTPPAQPAPPAAASSPPEADGKK